MNLKKVLKNNKGFTLVEVIVSFGFVIILLGSMYAVYRSYQGSTSKESIKLELETYKNSMIQIIYDDIIKNNMTNITNCPDNDKCVNINSKDKSYKLEVIDDGALYLSYDGTKYIVPDSQNGLIEVENFICNFNSTDKVYNVKIKLNHSELSEEENNNNIINIVVSGKEYSK